MSKIKRIAHLADIHIRLHTRKEEYEQVFQNLYKSLRDNKINEDGTIIVAGDIFHSKGTLSPECVALASEFLRTLSDIAPTSVLVGNHDTLEKTKTRLDSLTPIIDALNIPNLCYLKKSGLYASIGDLGNMDFGVFSLMGSPDAWPRNPPANSKKQIALYHGPVKGAKTDIGYTIEDHCVSLDMFDGYDCVLLGDIHKTQYLQAANPTVMYAGSLIQQNYGESLDNHGWVEWNLENDTQTFHEIENEYGFVTLELVDGAWNLPVQFPKKSKIRLIISGDTSQADVKKATALLKKKTEVLELLVVNTSSKITSAAGPTLNNIAKDVHDVLYQNSLIKQYLADSVSKDLLLEIEKINIETNDALTAEYLPKNITWIPKLLNFDNLFSYGENNTIDFSKLQGVYGIFSPNATGKSSMINSICFALYDKTPTAFKGNHIMNMNSKTCRCEFQFEVDSVLYKIVRSGVKKKTREVKIDVMFYKQDDTEWINLSGKDRRDTNASIRALVGEYEDFVLTMLSVQNNNSIFLDKGQTDRKELLSQFLGLTIFDKLHAIASEEFKEIKNKLKVYSDMNYAEELINTKNTIESLQNSRKVLAGDIEEYSKELDELRAKNTKLEISKHSISTISFDFKTAITKRADYLVNIQNYTRKIDELELSLQKYGQFNDIEDIDFNDIEFTKKSIADVKAKSIQMSKDQAVLLESIRYLEKSVAMLHQHKYDPTCKFCIDSQLVKNGTEDGIKLTAAKEKLEYLQLENSMLDDKLAILLKAKETNDILVAEYNNKLARDKQTAEFLLEIEKLKSLIMTAEREIENLNNKLEYYYTNKAHIEENLVIEEELKTTQLQQTTCTAKLSTCQAEINSIDSKLIGANISSTNLLLHVKQLEVLSGQYKAYEAYLSAIDPNGIAYQLIEQILPVMEQTINNILAQIVSFSLQLYCDGKNVQIDLLYDSTTKWPLELASGMEKFISGLAIRMAMLTISHLPKSSFIIIDEGFSNLDADNLSSMAKVLDYMKQQFDFIIIVSHLTEMRDMVDELIEIQQIDGKSYIQI